jgi:hypothetical protein
MTETGYYISSSKGSYVREFQAYSKETNFAEWTCLLQPFAPGSILHQLLRAFFESVPPPCIAPHQNNAARLWDSFAVTQRAKL